MNPIPTTAITEPMIARKVIFSFKMQNANGKMKRGLVEFNVVATEASVYLRANKQSHVPKNVPIKDAKNSLFNKMRFPNGFNQIFK